MTSSYPKNPGCKERGKTSEAAATSMRSQAASLRRQVLRELSECDLSADQAAAILEKSILSIRPRFSELFLAGKIEKTEKRARNASGKMAVVWKLKGGTK